MPANTGKGIAYPVAGDPVEKLYTVFANLASSIDTVLNGYIPTSDRAVGTDVTSGTSTTKVVTPKSLKDAGIVPPVNTSWANIPLSSGYTADPGPGQQPQYRVKDNVLYTRGKIQRTAGFTTGVAHNNVATLPVGARPTVRTDRTLSGHSALQPVKGIIYDNGSISLLIGAYKPNYVDISSFSGMPLD